MNSLAFLRIRQIIILMFGLIVMSACAPQANEAFTGDLREFAHQNGLVTHLPDELTAEITDNGFLIQPKGKLNTKERNTIYVSVERQSKFEVPANARKKTISNRTISYQIEESGEGSGGTEYRLTAWEFNESDITVYGQSSQTEFGTPDFRVCWRVIQHTQVIK